MDVVVFFHVQSIGELNFIRICTIRLVHLFSDRDG